MSTPLRFFHGTHSGNLEAIARDGLTPQTGPASMMRGNLSTLPGFTEHLVFLAPNIEEAAFYAVRQSDHYGTDPVILSVLVDDVALLTVGDDYLCNQAIEAMLATAGLPALEFDDDGDVHEYGTASDAYYFWRDIVTLYFTDLRAGVACPADRLRQDEPEHGATLDDLGHDALVEPIWNAMGAALRAAMEHSWERSIATDRDPSVGYRGALGPERLRFHPTATVSAAIHRHARGTGQAATWNLAPEDAPFGLVLPARPPRQMLG